MSSADDNSFKSEDFNYEGAFRMSSIARDASGHVYNDIHKSVRSRYANTSKTKLRFIERHKFEKNAMSRKQRQNYSILFRRFRSPFWAWCSTLLWIIFSNKSVTGEVTVERNTFNISRPIICYKRYISNITPCLFLALETKIIPKCAQSCSLPLFWLSSPLEGASPLWIQEDLHPSDTWGLQATIFVFVLSLFVSIWSHTNYHRFWYM